MRCVKLAAWRREVGGQLHSGWWREVGGKAAQKFLGQFLLSKAYIKRKRSL
jgi:hypothetical protein